MGSSTKKHKEKKEKKKHKKRSRSKDRDSHKKSHKSSHRKDKHKASGSGSPEKDASIPEATKTIDLTLSDDEFDVDKLLDSKLSENPDFVAATTKSTAKKRKREEAVQELRKKLNLPATNEDSLERFAEEQLEEHVQPGPSHFKKRSRSPEKAGSSRRIEYREEDEGHREPQLSLSISDTNKLRAKLGLRPLDVKGDRVEKKGTSAQPASDNDATSIIEANKLRVKLGLRTLEVPKEIDSESVEPQLSLSVSDTNKLRAKLGLKPLDEGKKSIPGIEAENAEKEITKQAEEVFVRTENIREKKKSEALREKLNVMKDKRKIEEKLRKTKGIADSDSEEESATEWIIKHQKILQEKQDAEKRAKLLEEMDAEFGIGALVDEEFEKKKAYTSQHLKGLTVGHGTGSFVEGQQVILTLKDKGVLDEEDDVLENVNFVDREKYAKNIENKKKKPDYQPYEEPEYDEFGILKKRNLLSKYDEEIEGEKKKSFKLGTSGTGASHVSREQELELIRMKLKQQNEITLQMPDMKVASEYYTPQDMVQFKKPKKRVKKQRLKAGDLVPDTTNDNDLGNRRRNMRSRIKEEEEEVVILDESSINIPQETSENMDYSSIDIEEDLIEKELHGALTKARKLKEKKIIDSAPEKVIQLLKSATEGGSAESDAKSANIEMNSVAEFCRTLGDIPTYGMSGNRDEDAEDMMDLERELLEERQKQELEASLKDSAWNEVDIEDKPAEISIRESEPILEEEPDIASGVAGALKLATKKGYLDKDNKKLSNAAKASSLQAKSYTIEEKFYEDDKFGKRDRYTGPVQDFKEKNNYRPDVKLEYIDDNGRLLTSKEAFRYLSHKFHGKGPGKNKVDKRMKKVDQDNKLKQMSSTDTPLNTVKLLQAKQKETQSPYIVLSGGNKTLTQTMISKVKPM